MVKVTFDEFFREQNRVALEQLAQIFEAGWKSVKNSNETHPPHVLAKALHAMEQKATELAKSWE